MSSELGNGGVVLNSSPRARGLDRSVRDGECAFRSRWIVRAAWYRRPRLGRLCPVLMFASQTSDGAAWCEFWVTLGPLVLSEAHSDFDAELNPEATTAEGQDSEGGCTAGRGPPDRLSDLEISVCGGVRPKVGARRSRGAVSVVTATGGV